MVTSQEMRARIEAWEGCRLTAYRDMVGVLTIGYGHTGADVHEGQQITAAEADQLLASDLHRFEVAVAKLAPRTTPGQFDALVSFAFNLGAGALQSSTLLRKHNAGDYVGAANEFVRWDHAGGREVQGLMLRRLAESDIYRNGWPE